MALVRVRRAAQLTLPADARRALNVKEGDFLESRIVQGGVLLMPMSVVERTRGWEQIERAVSQIVDREPNPGLDNQAEEEAIAESIKEFRRRHG